MFCTANNHVLSAVLPLYLCLCKHVKCWTVVNFKNCHNADSTLN